MNYKGVRINNAHEVVEWCKTHFSSNDDGTSSRASQIVPCRVFWEISGIYVQMHMYMYIYLFSLIFI